MTNSLPTSDQDVSGFGYVYFFQSGILVSVYQPDGLLAGNRLATSGDVSASSAREGGTNVSARNARA